MLEQGRIGAVLTGVLSVAGATAANAFVRPRKRLRSSQGFGQRDGGLVVADEVDSAGLRDALVKAGTAAALS